MEPTHEPPRNEPVAAPAELVVRNGRMNGARRPVNADLTLIGRDASCDIRLHADGVAAFHCALVNGPAGLVLRSLQPQTAARVNDKAVSACTLQDGDSLTVGPFHFQVQFGQPPAAVLTSPEERQREQEALRIQAAAVAAQQAALTEEEVKLQQQRVALERQQEQLAAHLDEKRRRLLELKQQLQEARATLQRERTEHDQRSSAERRDLARARGEADQARQQAQKERCRLVELRRRLKRRWHRHWDVHEAALHRREQQLASERRALEKDFERLQQERAALTFARLRFNGEAEVGRRQLQAAWQELHQAQRRWQEDRAREEARQRGQARALDEREADLLDAEQELANQCEEWEQRRLYLEQDIEGLENRVRNLRCKLADQNAQAAEARADKDSGQATPQAGVPCTPYPVPSTPSRSVALAPLTVLQNLAGDLADQRLHLVEQGERLLRVQLRWQEERDVAAAALEATAVRLQEWEQALAARERALEPAEMVGRQRREELAQLRLHLEGWQARLVARQAAWEAEREALLADVHSREERVVRYQTILAGFRQRWSERRHQEMTRWRTECRLFQEARQQYVRLGDEYSRRLAALETQQRALAEKALALEQYRLECLGQADQSAAAARRLGRLRRRWASLSAAAERKVARDRRALKAEAARLEVRAHHLEQQMAELARREEELSARQTDWQHQQAEEQGAQAKARQELFSLRAGRAQDERQLRALRDEVERMARLLLGEEEPPALPAVRAA